MNLPATFISFLLTVILVIGIKESASFNAAKAVIKVAVILFVIVVGTFYNPENWIPFAPYELTGVSIFGHTLLGEMDKGGEPLGMLAGAATIFFAYIGFDSVSTHPKEAKNPQRDVPVGIIASLLISTMLYVAVAAVLKGKVYYDKINIDAPISNVFKQMGLLRAQLLISLGALAGITSVLLVLMLSQLRVLLAMARDDFLPRGFFAAVYPKYRTPWKSTVLTGVFVALMGALLLLRILAELVNIGTFLAFVIVCAAVLIMHKTHLDAEHPFSVPFLPIVPALGMTTYLLLMFSLPAENWPQLTIWLGLGFVIYFACGSRNSHLRCSGGSSPPS
ncbi:MAG: amino acid permease [Acidobacteriota bacterium]|nr:amino acid permease [Acidobacteriota bacterium]